MQILNTNFDEYIDNEVKWYKNNYDSFLDDFAFNDSDSNDDVDDEIIEEWIYNKYNNDEFYYQDFMDDNYAKLDYEFEKYIGKRLNAKGVNLDWRHSNGEASFILEDVYDIERKLLPDCDKYFSIYKVDDNRYLLKCFHHDCPTGTYIDFNFSMENE